MALRSNRPAPKPLGNATTAVESTHLFTEGDDLYVAMLASIRSARDSVRMESYIFSDDEIGWQFTQALVERAAAGLDVRLHLDAAGALGSSSRVMERHLRERGVFLKWFHRWSWRHPLRYNRRNHRKLLIVDDQVAYVGGFNIHRQSSRRLYGDARWRDTHAAITGALVDAAGNPVTLRKRGTVNGGARHAVGAAYMASLLSCTYV